MANTNITFSIDSEDKEMLSKFCDEVGVTMSGLFNMCVKATLRDWEIQFRVGGIKPSKRLLEALRESEEFAKNPEQFETMTVEEALKEIEG